MSKNIKKRITQLVCEHPTSDDKGPVSLWNEETRMLAQCSICGFLFTYNDGNKIEYFEELPNMHN